MSEYRLFNNRLARSRVVDNLKALTILPILEENISGEARVMTAMHIWALSANGGSTT